MFDNLHNFSKGTKVFFHKIPTGGQEEDRVRKLVELERSNDVSEEL
jgi:hypothetical protein